MAGREDEVARFEALLAPPGPELLDLLGRLDASPADELRLAGRLRDRYPAGLVTAALAQHELRQRARAKFSRAGDMFFTRQGLEQASSEPAARHRARRFASAGLVADLCCGIGGDLIELARASRVLAVDADALHLRMAMANAQACGVAGHVTALLADVREASLTGVQAVFIDPARRSGGRRRRAGDSIPPLSWCTGLAERVGLVAVKTAPGIAPDAIPPGWELEFVAVGRELKEAVAWSPAAATTPRRATVLPAEHSLVSGQAPAAAVRPPGQYLFDPSPAVTRAGLVTELALALGAWQIDARIAFLSADAPATSPFARTLRVIDSAPWNERRLRARLHALHVGAADIRRRGLAGDVALLHRRLRLTGTRRATVVMTRVLGRPWGLVCVDADESGHAVDLTADLGAEPDISA